MRTELNAAHRDHRAFHQPAYATFAHRVRSRCRSLRQVPRHVASVLKAQVGSIGLHFTHNSSCISGSYCVFYNSKLPVWL